MEVRPLARLAYLAGLCIAGRNESDGVVTFGQIRRDCCDFDDLTGLVDELVSVGLWERAGEIFTIPSFLKWNKSRVVLEELREKRSKAGKMGGRPKHGALTDESNLLNDPNQVASTDESTRLKHVKAIEQNRTEYDRTELSRRSQTIALRDLAFSQSVKPTRGVKAVENMFERLLKAGHSLSDLEAAIRAGVEVWTDNGVAYAISQSKEKPEPGSNITDLVEEAARAIEDWYRTPEPLRQVESLPPLAQRGHEKLPSSVFGGNTTELKAHLRKLATAVGAS